MTTLSSPAWQNIKPATQSWYGKAFEWMKPLYDAPLVKFDKPLVVRVRDKALATKGWYMTNRVTTTLGKVFQWAQERGLVPENPAAGFRKIERPKDKPRSNRPWTDAERFTVLERAPPALRVTIALMMYTGMDPIDATRLRKNQYDGENLAYERAKTGGKVWMPAPDALQVILQAAPPHDVVTLSANSYGKPWTVDGFNSSWQRLKLTLEEEGAIEPGLTLKGLRHTKATLLREMGADDRTIADSLGQRTEAMARRYSRDANLREKMTEAGIKFNALERERRERFVKPKG